MRIHKQRSLLVLLIGLAMTSSVLAELAVIYDSGQTRPLAPLLKPLLPNHRPSLDSAESDHNAPSPLGPADLSNLLPVHSAGLRVDDIAGQRLKPDVLARLAQGNPRPFFLIGSDAVSLQWLKHHRDTLQSLGAVGLLVQADTTEDVRRVVAVAQGLPMSLGSGDDLAKALGIDRYPILITREGIRQ